MSIYKDCDIRGIYGEELTCMQMYEIGRAVSDVLSGRSIAVGGDFRTHTPPLKRALVTGLLEGGAQVYDVGLVSTPQLYFSKRHLGCFACAQVTASHNPARYNGLKLMLGALPVLPEDIVDLQRRVAAGGFQTGQGTLEKTDTTKPYEALLCGAFDVPKIPLRIVIDAGNGAMSEIAPRVMRALGFAVEELYCMYDGTFPGRDPNPAVQAHIRDLCERVTEVGADFGVAFDGDGDRAIFVDAQGVPLLAEEALVILVQHLLRRGDSVVYDLKCSSIVQQAVQNAGGTAIMERSGHAFIRRHFMQAGSILAGEVSGHYFFRELQGDDGLYALVRMAAVLCRTGAPLRSLLQAVRYPAITPDIRIHATPSEIKRVFEKMHKWAVEAQVEPDRLDGLRLAFANGSWVLLRRSITEPAFTLRLEAPNEQQLVLLRRTAAQKLDVVQLAP